MAKSKTLAQILERDSNNIDLVRLIAAAAVIYGHSFSLIKNVVGSDLLHRTIGLYSAEWGVKTFFFLSGLLVVNSAISGKGALVYCLQRFFRIWPALIFVAVGCAFVVGPLFTNMSLQEYFANPLVYSYIKNTVSFKFWGTEQLGYYSLPGVFENNVYKKSVNVPLWTLVVEIYAYAFILALSLAGALHKKAGAILFVIILADALLPERLIFFWLPKDVIDFSSIPFCFAVGGIMAIYKDKIRISAALPAGLLLLAYLMKGWSHERYLIYTALFMLVIWLSSTPAFIALKMPDVSYGLYLWGWPTQQCLAQLFPNIPFYPFVLISLIIATFMAYISWIMVEKRCIAMGRYISFKLKNHPINLNSFQESERYNG